MDFSPCQRCAAGDHDACAEGLCNCLEDHRDDSEMIRGFKRLKRMTDGQRRAAIQAGLSRRNRLSSNGSG